MRNLFLKIFLWFWLATILIIGATLVLMSLIEPYRPLSDDSRTVRRLSGDGSRAVRILERDGPDALRKYIDDRGNRPGRQIFLFNELGETVTGHEASQEAVNLALRSRDSRLTESLNMDHSIILAGPVYGSDGKLYTIVKEVPRRPYKFNLWRFLNPKFLSLRLLIIFVIASAFCYWLAWHLSSPVRDLRKAAQEIASGNLKSRVVPNLGSRKDELADLGHDFDLMAERIESLITSQGRLLRDISHELRSPLARLNVALELARKKSGIDAIEQLDRIEREAGRLNDLISQLRTLTLLESGTESIDRKTVNLAVLVKEISEDADFEAGNRNRSVKVSSAGDIFIEGSEELLRRAIENVVRNAVHYTPEGTEVEISLLSRKVKGKESAVLNVRDHGPGVPVPELDSLFQPLYRTSAARDRQSGGMGIGLTITERSVKLHGGNVKASNHPDGGLAIEIILPVTPYKTSFKTA